MANAADALRKLQSGQALTDAERKLLGISSTPASPASFRKAEEASTTSIGTPFGQAGSTITAPTTVTSTRNPSISASSDTRLGKLLAEQNAARVARDAAFANKPTEDPGVGYRWVWNERSQTWTKEYSGGSTGGTTVVAGGGTGGGSNVTLPAVPTGPTLAINTFKNTLALFFGEAEVAKPWVNELYKLSSPYYKSGSSIDEALNLALQEGRNNPNLKEFTTRFSGIFKLQDKLVSGVAVTVPTIAEYVASEAKMGEVLSAAGLGSLNTQQFLGDRIGDGVNVSEFTRRINDVYLRIDSLPQQAKSTINRYLPSIDKTQLAKALLTGTKGAAELAKEVSSYEVLSAAEQQGLGTLTTEGKAGLAGGVDLAQAAELSAMGYTFNTANQALGQVAQAAPTYEKILEMRSGQDVASGEAAQMLIQADVKKLASAERAKAQAIAEEAARFAGSAGTTKASFSSQRRGAF